MKRSRDEGFTLLEIVIVVLIISMAMAVSYPALSRGSSALRLRSTGRDVLNTFRYAREKAVTEQVRMIVTVDREKQQLIFSNGLGENSRRYSMPGEVKIQRMARAGTEVVEGPMVVRFLPNGSADNAEVLLRSDAGYTLRIITDPITGGARIESGEGGNQP